MAITQPSPRNRCGGEVADSQSWNWLTERFAYQPQVRLVFGEELPQLTSVHGNFVDL
jgi:hypothetical protein